jgi:hypothetical protein
LTWVAAWTRACSMDISMQHGPGHAAWTSACSMDMGMQHGQGHEHGHGRVAHGRTWTRHGHRLLLDRH